MKLSRPAECHPERKLFSRGMCQVCYQRQYRGTPLEGEYKPKPPRHRRTPTWGLDPNLAPPQFTGVQHNCFTHWPTACPKCGKSVTLEMSGREAHCKGTFGGCGWTGYLVQPKKVSISEVQMDIRGLYIMTPNPEEAANA